jgi:hypothetical protein
VRSIAGGEGIGRLVLRLGDPDIDLAMSIASNDEARVEISEIEGEAHAVVVRVDVGQRSGSSVQGLPRSHAALLCKVAAMSGDRIPGATLPSDPTEGTFSQHAVTNPHIAGTAAAPGARESYHARSGGLMEGMLIAANAE